ncbi:hypothetical protein NVS89_04490 [Ancylobacter sp. MQZ15Z-1]|uniref:Lipoprotein n=1 Tax=Ancylobacter mangrovi TaxID=2972472 RepID=A0A9X2T0W2_9HYPH|nr:hypothetical protein [Ancylobacter mangrovi]MCS0494345.1 hypothetical protein [Ancylobacter mangrovi]
MGRLLVFALGCLTLAGCSEDGSGVDGLDRHLQSTGKIGESGDYWLVKDNAVGQAERIGLIFGYANDGAACRDTADILNSRYTRANFRCAPVGD